MSELGEPHTQHSGLEDEISLGWRNFRESVSFYYPTISKISSDVDEYHMSIYMNHNTECSASRFFYSISNNKCHNFYASVIVIESAAKRRVSPSAIVLGAVNSP